MSAQPDDPPTIVPAVHASRRWLIPVVVVALATHTLVYFFFNFEPSTDGREYLALGTTLSDEGVLRLPTGECAKRMPLYPALIAVVDRWQGRRMLLNAVVEIQTLLSLLSTILIALIARGLSDDRGALVAGLIAALYAPFRYLQALILCETLVIALLFGALLLYLRSLDARRNGARWWRWAGTSTLLGLAVLTRADAGVFAVPFAIHAACRTGWPGPRMLRAGVLLVGVFLAALSWGYRNSRVVGEWTLSTTGGLNFYLGNNPDYAASPGLNKSDYGIADRLRREEGLTEVQADRRLWAMAQTFIAAHPGETFVNLFRKLRVWLGSSITWSAPGTLLVVIWTLVLSARASPRRFTWLAAAMFMSILWLAVLWRVQRPWTQPAFVVPLGLIGFFVFNDRHRVRGLLIGLFAAQLMVAIVFIPLERLRWTVDGILIIAIGAAVARICEYFSVRSVHSERSLF